MKAFIQGNIDYFCGVYAVINAFRWAARDQKRLTFNEGCLFYQHLMQYLIDKNEIAETLHHGTTCDRIVDLIEEARKYIDLTFGLQMTAERPFVKTDKSVSLAVEEMAEILKQPQTAWIIRLRNQKLGDHWSVGTNVASRGCFQLLDSYSCPSFNAGKALWAPEIMQKRTDTNPTGLSRPPSGKTFLLKEGQILIRIR